MKKHLGLLITVVISSTSLADSVQGTWQTSVKREGTREMRLVLDITPGRVTWSTDCVLASGERSSDVASAQARIEDASITLVEDHGNTFSAARDACQLGILKKSLQFKLEEGNLVVTDNVGTVRRFQRTTLPKKPARPVGALE